MRLVAMVALVGLLLACAPPPLAPTAIPDLTITIPPGAALAEMSGAVSVAIPTTLRVVVGQRIVVRNDDQAMHYFLERPIAPGDTLVQSFATAGRFRFAGMRSCSVGQISTLTVEVLPGGAA